MRTDITLWNQIVLEERAKLIVSADKRKWILKTYPPDETGRPGFFAPKEERSSVGINVTRKIPFSWELESNQANESPNTN